MSKLQSVKTVLCLMVLLLLLAVPMGRNGNGYEGGEGVVRWMPEKLDRTAKYEIVTQKERKENGNRFHLKISARVDSTGERGMKAAYSFHVAKAVLVVSLLDSIKEVTREHEAFLRRTRGIGLWEKPPRANKRIRAQKQLPLSLFEPEFSCGFRIGRHGDALAMASRDRYDPTLLPAPFPAVFPAYVESVLTELRMWGTPLEMGRKYEVEKTVNGRKAVITLLPTLRSSRIRLDYTWEETWEIPVYPASGLDAAQKAEKVGFRNRMSGRAVFDPDAGLFRSVDEKIESDYTGRKDYAVREGSSGFGTWKSSVKVRLK